MSNVIAIDKKLREIGRSNLSFLEKIDAAFNTKSYEKYPELKKQKALIDTALDYYHKSNVEFDNGDLVQKNPMYYLGALAHHAKYGTKLNGENIAVALFTINREQELYNLGNGFFKFLSYIFPNKYRTQRNNIQQAKNILIEKGLKADRLDEMIEHAADYLVGDLDANPSARASAYLPEFKFALDETDHYLEHADLSKADPKVINTIKTLKGLVEKENKRWNDFDATIDMGKDFTKKEKTTVFEYADEAEAEDEIEMNVIPNKGALAAEKAFYKENVDLDKELDAVRLEEDKMELPADADPFDLDEEVINPVEYKSVKVEILDDEFGEIDETIPSDIEDKEVIEDIVNEL